MSGEKHFVTFAIAVGLGVLGPASTAWAQYDYEYQGGYVKPCSLDGVNPAYHLEIFGNPAAAREFGFFRSPDGTWHASCAGGRDQTVRDQAVMGGGESTSQRAPHRRRAAPHKVAKSDL
jgi:hypothetical protein